MATFANRLRLIVDLGLALLALGLAGLLVLAWIQYIRTPSLSLVDAYWVGREPWTSLGIWTVLLGSTLALAVGVLVAVLDGSWIRKLLALATLILATLWWAVALGIYPLPRYQSPAPATLAYSLPETAALLLLLPAVLAGALALAPRRDRPSSRMAPVHQERSSKEGRPGL